MDCTVSHIPRLNNNLENLVIFYCDETQLFENSESLIV